MERFSSIDKKGAYRCCALQGYNITGLSPGKKGRDVQCVFVRACVCFVQSQWLGGQWQARGKRIMSQLHTTSLLIINNHHSLLVTVSLWNTPSVAKRRCCDTQDNCISNPRPPQKKKKSCGWFYRTPLLTFLQAIPMDDSGAIHSRVSTSKSQIFVLF